MSIDAMKQALTDERIGLLWREACERHDLTRDMVRAFARAIEAAAELRCLHTSEREGWRYAGELDADYARLKAVNAQLLESIDDAYRHLTRLQPVIANGLLTKQQLAFIDPHIDMALAALAVAGGRT